MKKLISAATSLAMAATMLSAAVPFATGAAAARSMELKAYLNPDGTQASTTINVSDESVTVPVALFATTDADIQALNARFTVNSKDGDASKVIFEGEAPITSGMDYFTTEQTFQTSAGEISTTKLVCWNDSITVSKRGGTTISSAGTYTFFNVPAGDQYNPCTNACMSGVWIGSGYSWAGESSSDFPIIVVPVTFPKGLPAGDYTLDFVNEANDDKGNYSTMMEGAEKYSKATGGIEFAESAALTITVKNDSDEPQVTTAPPVTTEAPKSTTVPDGPKTTAAPKTTSPDAANKKTDDSITISGGEYTVDFSALSADDVDADGNASIIAAAALSASFVMAGAVNSFAEEEAPVAAEAPVVEGAEAEAPAEAPAEAEAPEEAPAVTTTAVAEPIDIATTTTTIDDAAAETTTAEAPVEAETTTTTTAAATTTTTTVAKTTKAANKNSSPKTGDAFPALPVAGMGLTAVAVAFALRKKNN